MDKNPFASLLNLFAFAIATLLIAALLLPAIARQRQSARSSACINNMRQIGLGLHNYHAAYKQLPQATGGTTANGAPELGNARRLGPLVALSPFVEQQRLWEVISNPYVNPDTGQKFPPMGPVPWYPAERYAPWGMAPDLYQCPGDDMDRNEPAEPKIVYTLEADAANGTTTSYVACYGDGTLMQAEQSDDDDAAAEMRRRAANRGIFVAGTVIRFRDVLDGLSNTIMYSEVVASRVRKPGESEIARDVKGISKNPSLCVSAVKADDVQFWPFGRGALWADGFLPISGFQTVLPPNSASCTSDLGIEDAIASASSTHAGGVYVLMADGAVRFASDTIDTGDLTSPGVAAQPGYTPPGSKSPYGVWGALGSRASREVITDLNTLTDVTVRPGPGIGRSVRPPLSRWTDKSGRVSLQAEMVQIIDEKTIQLKSANGTLHEVPLNSLRDRDIYRAIQQDLLRKQQN